MSGTAKRAHCYFRRLRTRLTCAELVEGVALYAQVLLQLVEAPCVACQVLAVLCTTNGSKVSASRCRPETSVIPFGYIKRVQEGLPDHHGESEQPSRPLARPPKGPRLMKCLPQVLQERGKLAFVILAIGIVYLCSGI